MSNKIGEEYTLDDGKTLKLSKDGLVINGITKQVYSHEESIKILNDTSLYSGSIDSSFNYANNVVYFPKRTSCGI